MKLCLISDTHNKHRNLEIPQCDILISAGDISFRGEYSILRDFNEWCAELKDAGTVRHAITIAGNHELSFEDGRRQEARSLLTNWIYLQDSSVEIGGLKFFGSPHTPEFFSWAFNLPRNGDELAQRWSKIPENTDVLITHGPPYGICDYTIRGPQGCERLARRVSELPNLKLHVFGHLHEGYGRRDIGKTIFVNAASCDDTYRAVHAPILLEI